MYIFNWTKLVWFLSNN